jgi:hypothetical protein
MVVDKKADYTPTEEGVYEEGAFNVNLAYLNTISRTLFISYASIVINGDPCTVSYYTQRYRFLKYVCLTLIPKVKPSEGEYMLNELIRLNEVMPSMIISDYDGVPTRIRPHIARDVDNSLDKLYVHVVITLEKKGMLTFKAQDARFSFGGFGA